MASHHVTSLRIMSTTTISARTRHRLQIEMRRQDVSGVELARRVGMTQPSMSRRLRGRIPITLDEIEQFAEALEVPVERLLSAS